MPFPILSTECRAQIVLKSPSESPGLLWFPDLKLWPYIYPPFLSRCLSMFGESSLSFKILGKPSTSLPPKNCLPGAAEREAVAAEDYNILRWLNFSEDLNFSGIKIISGWWWLEHVDTCFIVHFIYGIIMIILPIDELHHFSRWAHCTTNQISSFMYCDFLKKPPGFLVNSPLLTLIW